MAYDPTNLDSLPLDPNDPRLKERQDIIRNLVPPPAAKPTLVPPRVDTTQPTAPMMPESPSPAGAFGGDIPALARPPKETAAQETKAVDRLQAHNAFEANKPTVTSPFGTEPYYQQKEAQSNYAAANPWGSPGNHPGFFGKMGHALAKAGNIAGDIFAPATMAMIPGTDLNKVIQTRRNEAGIAEAAKTGLENAEAHKAMNPPEKYSFHYTGPDGKTYGVRPDGSVDELPAAAQKPTMSVQKFTEAGPDGKPVDKMVVVNESKLAGLKPADGKQFTLPELEAVGAVTPMNIGQPVAKPGTGKPTYKMVPTGAETEALALFDDPNDPSKYHLITPSKKTGSVTVLTDPNTEKPVGIIDNKSGQISPLPPIANTPAAQAAAGGLTPMATRAMVQRQNQFNSEFMSKAVEIQTGLQQFDAAMANFNTPEGRKTGADTMLMLSKHLALTFGQVKGTRQTNDMIHEHLGARPLSQDLEVMAEKLTTGQVISDQQIKAYHDLIHEAARINWEWTVKEAIRRGLPVPNDVPSDITFDMKTPKGTKVSIPVSKVQDAINDKLKWADEVK